jgi:hypothetical protein
MPNIFLPVWFVANYLAAHGLLDISFTDSCQNFGNSWATKSYAKKLASQFWQGCLWAQTKQALKLQGPQY